MSNGKKIYAHGNTGNKMAGSHYLPAGAGVNHFEQREADARAREATKAYVAAVLKAHPELAGGTE